MHAATCPADCFLHTHNSAFIPPVLDGSLEGFHPMLPEADDEQLTVALEELLTDFVDGAIIVLSRPAFA